VSWEKLCTHGDDEATVRAVLLDEFDLRWPAIARDIRAQLLDQGATLAVALDVAEQARRLFRNEQADRAPAIMDAMAASASPQH
jgi:hypothetical protein